MNLISQCGKQLQRVTGSFHDVVDKFYAFAVEPDSPLDQTGELSDSLPTALETCIRQVASADPKLSALVVLGGMKWVHSVCMSSEACEAPAGMEAFFAVCDLVEGVLDMLDPDAVAESVIVRATIGW